MSMSKSAVQTDEVEVNVTQCDNHFRVFHIGDARLGSIRIFDARVKILSPRHQCENSLFR